MKRRRFLLAATAVFCGSSRLAAPTNAQTALPRIGMLLTGTPSTRFTEIDAFIRTLGELGWTEGQTVEIQRRWGQSPEQFAQHAAELVRANVAVILAPGPEATRAARGATETIPIIMVGSADPRYVGVTSLAKPERNLTGFTIGQIEVVFEKRLELLREVLPRLAVLAVLWDVRRFTEIGDAAIPLKRPAETLGLRLRHIDVKDNTTYGPAFTTAKREGAGAMLVIESPRAVANRVMIADLGLKNRLPTMSQFRPMVQAGGLLSYGADLDDLFRRAAGYVDRVIRGARPSDLPIQQPVKFSLVLNANTARALNLTIPSSMLLRADEVIE